MALIKQIISLLPPLKYCESLFSKEDSQTERAICACCYKNISCFESTKNIEIENQLVLVCALKDKLYEIINIGHWSKVDEQQRKRYTFATFLKIIYSIWCANENQQEIIEKCIFDLDLGLILGCALNEPYRDLLTNTIEILNKNSNLTQIKRRRIESENPYVKKTTKYQQIETIIRPSVEHFRQNYFLKKNPVVLKECIGHWPAIEKWHDSNYLISIAGERTVPIEIGKTYTNDEWSQDLVKFKDFFARQVVPSESCDRIEYLAQHNLFDQIPALRSDIISPEYCCLSDNLDREPDLDIKAWLGPKGTISPMHQDPKYNLLCQVIGMKKVILAAPSDTENLYPHLNRMLQNTSQVDVENINFDKFPLVRNVKFYETVIGEGDMLYIPIEWWHYVRSLEKSFSVSFWWT